MTSTVPTGKLLSTSFILFLGIPMIMLNFFHNYFIILNLLQIKKNFISIVVMYRAYCMRLDSACVQGCVHGRNLIQ